MWRWLLLLSTNHSGRKHTTPIAENQIMKVISQKQMKLAMERIAGLLKEDGADQTLTVQEWLDVVEVRPAQFRTSAGALQILALLGFGNEIVRAEPVG